jgi:hypothetical protein
MTESSALLRRFERTALVLAALAFGLALALPGGDVGLAMGVAGGALLAATSYWAIKRGVTGLADAVLRTVDRPAPRSGRGVLALVVRYALLAGMAYVMIARLRLHPIGLLIGVSVIPLAAMVEAVRPRP